MLYPILQTIDVHHQDPIYITSKMQPFDFGSNRPALVAKVTLVAKPYRSKPFYRKWYKILGE